MSSDQVLCDAPLGWRIAMALYPDEIEATPEELLLEILGSENYNWLIHCTPNIRMDEVHQNLINVALSRVETSLQPRHALWIHIHGLEAYRLLDYSISSYDYDVYCRAALNICRRYALNFAL